MQIKRTLAALVSAGSLMLLVVPEAAEAAARCDHGEQFPNHGFSHSHPHDNHTHNWYFHQHGGTTENHWHYMHEHVHGSYDYADGCTLG